MVDGHLVQNIHILVSQRIGTDIEGYVPINRTPIVSAPQSRLTLAFSEGNAF